MNKITFYIVLLQSLFLGMGSTNAQSLPINRLKAVIETGFKPGKATESTLPASQVWVINQDQQVQKQPFMWVVKDPHQARQQPFLQAAKTPKKPGSSTKPSPEDGLESFDEVVKDSQKLEGLFTLYRQKEKNKIYLEIKPEQLQKNFLATATLESGIGEGGIYSGMPLQDFLFYFQRVDNNLHFVVRNVNFRTRQGDPQARSLARSFSDSVLYTIPIKSINSERKTILIDLGDLLLTDLAGLSVNLELTSNSEQTYFGNAKAFPHNLEIESIFNFSNNSGGKNESENFEVLPDNRGFTLRVHYSLSQLPNNYYIPRLADDRVGYFLTAHQDLSIDDRNDPFVRYINRWNLEKQDPTAAISPPKKPIVFWIDNAVPFEYRDAIKEGVLMWNQAFLKAGFKNAIEVRQMPDNPTWDAADIRYNTIRWINTIDGYFAMGPSRVNPLTGEILDADIIVDASFLRALKNEYRQIVLPNKTKIRTSLSALMENGLLCGKSDKTTKGLRGNLSKLAGEYDLCYGIEAANQFAFGSLAMSLLPNITPTKQQVQDYIHQYLRLIIAHEVGHTLGLRHNFRGSTLLPPEEMNNREITRSKGLTASVMDYVPPNIAPYGTQQGDYFPDMVGSYDQWAIQYGYTPTQAKTPIAEKPFLEQIAKQSENPDLSYSPDEDVSSIDPTSAPWDNSNNVLIYSKWQLNNSRLMWEKLNKGHSIEGDSYSDLSEKFSTIFGNYLQQLYYTSKYIGGQSFYRVHPGDSKKRLPFVSVPVEQQRQALATLQEYVFAEDALKFSPELLNKLAPSRWYHWGSNPKMGRLDYPVHDLVLFVQSIVLSDLLSSDRLSRLKDIELKSAKGEALALPELFDTLQTGIWTEVLKPKGKLEISSLRRGLQRQYVNFLTAMVLRKVDVPEDGRTLAWYKLKQLDQQLRRVKSDDEYTKAHLLETRDRIEKTLNAPLQGN
ncbi:zinc-dependent metalloprotease [Anabaena cylindrica FACHB-243]|uniref:Peptidase M43B pregnancy-associated plasma-A n=1 Tax=Anabaena cylindrica (strain ATCC 27899 / PCC 7122) TaxID=272123 RepID=K9ZB48_ANACC|nr:MULTISPECIES: zinc-dependent metalloprotease [Anabaena]AFZ55959.1 Peptidase M43B pregnancy-associated plasma-A [Anabaena cylindrica PCC 7122]MBD2421379.1 zinc-dependent metalloprotease [Anabaena cylindrica FACHB-243]MBY5284319.1 zinc-dependent metalloprotease [Anabaena sp. CCAP 1446/1C]MBY5306225.1 zinc-dependent metalloprotease [Anabaena sp. CCAP 1446/1C]MCM2406712.1 zinc-dependent metalloprotease [Anabaena sp. CCAP 1446/1C]